MKTGPRLLLIAAAAAVIFGAALFGAAWLGIAAAKRTLPEEMLVPAGPTVGDRVTLDPAAEPIYLADDAQALRDFWFLYQNAEARRAGDAEARGLRRVFEPLEIEVLRVDADAVEIEARSGPLAGRRAWVPRDQLSARGAP